MVREKTSESIKEVLAEITRMRSELVTDEELADAQSNIIRQLPSRFETASETAGTIGSLALYGLPLDELANRAARVQKVTKDDVKRVATTYLKTDEMRVILVGDAKIIKGGLAGLGLGDVEMVTPPPKPTLPEGSEKPVASKGGGAKKPAIPMVAPKK